MNQQVLQTYEVKLPNPYEGNVFAFVKSANAGLTWLKENGREGAFLSVYSRQGKIIFELNDRQTALLMRLSLG